MKAKANTGSCIQLALENVKHLTCKRQLAAPSYEQKFVQNGFW
jgi:hypothetical protein